MSWTNVLTNQLYLTLMALAIALWAGTWYLVCGPLCSVTGQQAFAALPPFCRRSTSEEFSLKSQFPWPLGALEVGPRNGIWLTKSELWIENIFIAETQKYYFLTNIICRYVLFHQSCCCLQSDNNALFYKGDIFSSSKLHLFSDLNICLNLNYCIVLSVNI